MTGTMAPSDAVGSGPASTSALQPPPGYKLIKVKKADGTIITVKKKLSPGESPWQHGDTPEGTNPKYKIITVRMPDGSLAKVKRPIKPGADAESPSAKDTTPCGTVKDGTMQVSSAQTISQQRGNLKAQDISRKRQGRARFKAALVHGLVGAATAYLPDLVDGDELVSDSDISDDEEDETEAMAVTAATSTVAAAATAAGALTGTKLEQEQTAKPTSQSALHTAHESKSGTEKTAYKITVQDLKELDEKAAEQEANALLERRWAEFSFYLMASLSIILPALFLVLTAFIMAMDGKPTTSNWGKMIDPIRISVTVWPIVFAAVTARGFKTWATFKVERGIKLMELEQLVGSNSFGSVMKQPFFLRRLDFLTLLIFVIWALSPIGSQALIRVYTLERGIASDTVPVLYAPLLGDNRLLSPGAETRISNATALSEYWQAVCVYFIGGFLPDGGRTQADPAVYEQDLYNHPFPRFNTSDPMESTILSGYGLPVALGPAVVQLQAPGSDEAKEEEQAADAVAPFETITFPITSSYFNVSCETWKTSKRSAISDSLEFSLSETLGLTFLASSDNTTMDRMQFATLLDGASVLNRTNPNDIITPELGWEYAAIDCELEQVFYNSTVTCWLDPMLGSNFFSCSMQYLTVIPANQVPPEWHTRLTDFSFEFVRGGSPYPVLYPYTPIESWSLAAANIDGYDIKLDPLKLDPREFAANFAVLLNTFITVAHCPECIPVLRVSSVHPELVSEPDNGYHRVSNETAALYVAPDTDGGKARRSYSPPGLVFSLDWRWVWTLLACVVILLIVGVASVALESLLVAPDVLGYASTLARNSRHLHLPQTAARPMGGNERARIIGGVSVMMQDVKPNQEVGKIALGLKHDRAERLRSGRLYR